MKIKNKNKQQSGFVKGRSGNGSSFSDNKTPKTKYEKKLAKLNKAKEDLVDILKNPDFSDIEIIKKKKKKHSSSKEIELYDGGKSLKPKKRKKYKDFNEDDPTGMIGSELEEDFSVFKDELDNIKKMVSTESSTDYNAEAVNKLLLRSMLAMTLDIIPIAETAFRETKKENAAYAVNALINQAREIATDLKMSGDVENQARFIKESIVLPIFTAQAQNMLQEMMTLKAVIDTEVTNTKVSKIIKRNIDNTLKSMAVFMTQATEKISENIEAYLSGDVSFNTPKAKKKKRT